MSRTEVPGICPRQDLVALIEGERIKAPSFSELQIQPASIDLRLGDVAHCIDASFLPDRNQDVADLIPKRKKFSIRLDEEKPALLKKGLTYLIPLQESLSLPEKATAYIDPKSTTGRSGNFTRTLIDRTPKFNTVTGGEREKKLYLECTPLAFDTLVRKGVSLNQMRVGYGNTRVDLDSLEMTHGVKKLFYNLQGNPLQWGMLNKYDGGIDLTVDLLSPIVAYRAKDNSEAVFDFTRGKGSLSDKIDEFWETIEKPSSGELILEKGVLYLIGTREKLCFPKDMCGTLKAYEIGSAEGRIHYAGFFDPGFGYDEARNKFGTIAVLEPIMKDVPFTIVDGQPIGNIEFDKMRFRPVLPNGKSGAYGEGPNGSNYQGQAGTTLPKQFHK